MKTKILYILILISITAYSSQETVHLPQKLIQHVNVLNFGDVVLTVIGKPKMNPQSYADSIIVEFKKQKHFVPSRVLNKLGFLELNNWKVTSESSYDGRYLMYISTSVTRYNEEGNSKHKYTLVFDKHGYSKTYLMEDDKSFEVIDQRNKEKIKP